MTFSKVNLFLYYFKFFFYSGGRFISICEGIRLPDDVSMGFIIGKMYNNYKEHWFVCVYGTIYKQLSEIRNI